MRNMPAIYGVNVKKYDGTFAIIPTPGMSRVAAGILGVLFAGLLSITLLMVFAGGSSGFDAGALIVLAFLAGMSCLMGFFFYDALISHIHSNEVLLVPEKEKTYFVDRLPKPWFPNTQSMTSPLIKTVFEILT